MYLYLHTDAVLNRTVFPAKTEDDCRGTPCLVFKSIRMCLIEESRHNDVVGLTRSKRDTVDGPVCRNTDNKQCYGADGPGNSSTSRSSPLVV